MDEIGRRLEVKEAHAADDRISDKATAIHDDQGVALVEIESLVRVHPRTWHELNATIGEGDNVRARRRNFTQDSRV